MSGYPDLIDRTAGRRFIAVEQATVEVLRQIGASKNIPKGKITVQAILLSWAEFRTHGVLRHRVVDMNRQMELIAQARQGPADLWFQASYKDIREDTFNLFGKNAIPEGIHYLGKVGLLERRIPERIHEGTPSSYRLRADRLIRLYEGLSRKVDLDELLEQITGPVPDPGQGVPRQVEGVPDPGEGVPLVGEGVPDWGHPGTASQPDGHLRPVTFPGEPVPGSGGAVTPIRGRPVPVPGETGTRLGTPLYGEERKEGKNNSEEARLLCDAFYGHLSRRLSSPLVPATDALDIAERLLGRFPLADLLSAAEFAQTEPFWQTRAVSLSAFEKSIETIMLQMPGSAVDPLDADL